MTKGRPNGGSRAIKRLRRTRSKDDRELRALLRWLIAKHDNPARLLELYYWSSEPALIASIRQFISLPEQPKDALQAFLSLTADCPDTIKVVVTNSGEITFASPALAKLMREMEDEAVVRKDKPEIVH